ncbi:golgin subfamily A member 5-like [Homalodisca vitripennis]|uniref:golgin subfamily A member 5-like n=1 Tax=Homalodisca vitripennis TaxID=197043 RepID=UPI001EEC98F8|nr:golgin subfamily A member 5-like [Homalodisca vitripennis]
MEHAEVTGSSNVGVKEAEMGGPEGSDSGVEVNGSAMGGMGGDVTPAASCDSSLVSCCYSSEDLVSNTLQLLDDLSLSAGDGTSEGGSESSSVAGYHQPRLSSSGGVRKKCPLTRTPSTNRPSPSPNLSSRSKTPLSCRERVPSGKTTSSKTTPKSLHSSRAITTPSTTPRSHRDTSDSSTSRKTVARVPSASRTKTTNGSSPTDDGRWPSTVNKIAQKCRPLVNDKKNTPMNSSVTSVESKATALEKYATLPRRRRKSADNLTLSEPLSSREPSLNRTASLRKKQNPMVSSANAAMLQPLTSPSPKTMPPYPRKSRMTKTRIYHEVSIQTSLTGADLENGLGSPLLKDVHSRVETRNCGVQVERGMRRIEQLETQLKECKLQLSRLAEEREEISKTCDQMRTQQLTRDAETIRLKTLIIGKHDPDDVVGQLEQQVLSTNSLISQQQEEIGKLHSICHTLQRELEKSYSAQKMMLKQQEEMEAESAELQEFLQAEKAALADTLRDLENELAEARLNVAAKEAELQRQQEECSHLVRISEQRRQEQLSLEARLAGMELRSRESLLQQGAAVSGASVALSRLGTRLDNLVEALVSTYNISEHDLEDVIFHNEAYSQSSSSPSSSADTSPEHQHQSATAGFMSAVLNAIRTATSSRLPNTEPSSDAEPMLSSEPEPFCVRCPPSKHSEFESEACGGRLENSESLHNLSLAILRRQQLEAEEPMALPPVPAHTLVDQVIEVDNLVTRLLKVIRIVPTSQ